MLFSLLIGANEVFDNVDTQENPPTVETNTLLIPVLNFTVFNRISDSVTITAPAAFDEVKLTVRGVVVFGGIINAVFPKRISGTVLSYEVTAAGYHKTLDYVETFRDNFASAKAGVIIRTLLNKYAPWITATPATIQDGPVVSQLDVRNRNMAELFSELSQDAGFVFYVDDNKVAFFKPKEEFRASLLIKDAATTYIPESLEVVPDFSRVVNVVKVIGGPQKGKSVTETFTGDGTVANFSLEFKPFGINQASLLEDDFSGTLFSPAQWLETDVTNPSPPPNHVSADGYIFPEFNRLQVVGGNGTLGQVALTSTETYQGKIGREFLCEEVFITALSEGVVCAVTDGIGSTLADVKTGFFLKSSGALHIVVNGVDTTLSQYTDSAGAVQAVAPTFQISQTYNFMVRITAVASNIVASLEVQGGTTPNYGTVGGRKWSLFSSVTLTSTPDPTFVGFAPILSTNAQLTIRSAKLRGQVPVTLTVAGVPKVVGTETATSTFMDAFVDVNSIPNRLRFFTDTIPANTASISITYDKTEETVVRRRNSASVEKVRLASKLTNDSGERHATITPPFVAKTLDDLARIALNYLSEFANEKYTGRVVTYTSLLTVDTDPPKVGQLLHLDLPSQAIGPLDVVISQITQTVVSSSYKDTALVTAPIVQYEIEFADVDTYQDFIKRNQQDLKTVNKEGDSSQFLDVWDSASVITIGGVATGTLLPFTNAIVGEAIVVSSEVGVGSD